MEISGPRSPVKNHIPKKSQSKPKVVEVTHDKEESVVFTEKLTGFRSSLRKYCYPFVKAKSSTNFIVNQQKSASSLKTRFWNTVSIVGSHDFFVAFFPMLLQGIGCTDLAQGLLMRTAFGIYFGNWFKDYLCLPRPPVPPVKQLDLHASHGHEFGLPSTHAISAICLPFFTLFWYLSPADGLIFYTWFLIASVYSAMVMYSRLYLGMHSIADIVVGAIVGIFMLIGGEVVDYLMENQMISLPDTPFGIFLFGIFLLALHMEPVGPCPCYVDSACFLGSAFGFLSGKWRRTDLTETVNITMSLFFIRWIIGASLLFGSRLVIKPLLRFVGYKTFEAFKWPTKTYIMPGKGKNKKPIPSPKYDIEILLKYCCYFAMVTFTTECSPYIISYFQLW